MQRLLILLILLATKAVTAQPITYSKILPNGFTIYVIENHEQPQVYGAVAVRAGSKHDPKEATGIAHYLEHMLFKGTEQMGTTNFAAEKIWLDSITYYYDELGKLTDDKARLKIQLKINELSIKAGEYAIPNEVDRMLAEIGGSGVNAYTTVESTVYYNTFPSNQLEKWMEIYSHRFQKPVFRLFQSELETVYEEKNRKMDDKYMQVFDDYLKKFFKHHPYGQQTTLGETEHLKNPSLRRMYEFFNTYYVPNNMGLIICGDVNHEQVFALAEKKFGVMQRKEVPEFTFEPEAPFKGKEIIRIHKTPISAGVVGFRLPKNTDPDMPALEVISNLLTNNASSGSIDNLINDRKLMMAGLMYMPYMDGGTAFLYFVPKPVIQTLKRAEKMALKCLDDIKDGKFSDEDLVAVKTNRMKHLQLSYESNGGAAGNLIDAYIKGVAPNAREKEVEAIQNLTREDIQRVAKKYFGANSLAMYSRMGYFNGKPEKLKKPPFKPVVPKNETHSEYYNEWKKINAEKASPKFIDFANEIDSIPVATNNWILKNKNPFNNIVSMNLVFGTGKHYIPVLDFTDSYLMNCGTTSTPTKEFNKKLYALGCTFTVDAGAHQFAVKLSFPEENLQNVLLLIGDLMEHPAHDKKAMKKIHDEIRGEKYMDTRSPYYWSDALLAYAIYGKQSAYLDRMTYQELKIKGIPGILQSIADLKKASLKVVYTGNIAHTELVNALTSAGFNTARNTPQPVYFPTKREYKQPVVYVVNTRKARQSQVEIIKIGEPYNKTDLPNISAFNKYFGGDMSSIMFQEVREFRSLAYSTSGSYYFPTQTGNKGVFIASAGTQSDKTLDCVEIMHKIANEMPLHSERMDAVRSSLMEQGSLARPSFRNVISYIETWKRRGFSDDPVKTNFERYSKMSFDDLVEFYDQAIKTKPTVTCVTGRVKSFDIDELKKYGKIVVINKYSLVKQ